MPNEQTIFTSKPKIPIDTKVEEQYSRLERWLKIYEKDGNLNRWFVNLMNKYGCSTIPLEKSDISTLILVTDCEQLTDLRKRYQYNYTRPIFHLQPREYQNFYKKFTGTNTCFSGGCNIRGGNMDLHPLTEGIGMIITTNHIHDNIYHELRHSIDTYSEKREGENKILGEVIAYFGNIVRPEIMLIKSRSYDSKGNEISSVTKTKTSYTTIDFICGGIKDESYHQKMCPEISTERYIAAVDDLEDTLKNISLTYSKQRIDETLFRCIKIGEIIPLL